MTHTYDVLIIGAGVIGCSVARELSRYRLSVCVAEKGPDICMETSNRNSAVLHAGYNNTPGIYHNYFFQFTFYLFILP